MVMRVIPTIPEAEQDKSAQQSSGGSRLLVRRDGVFWLAREDGWQEVAVRDFDETTCATEWMNGFIGGSIAGIVATVVAGLFAQLVPQFSMMWWVIAVVAGAGAVAAIVGAAVIRIRLRHVVAESPESDLLYWRFNESLMLRDLDDVGGLQSA